jgi:hypothetical protein
MVKTRSPSCEGFLPQPFPQADIFVTMKKHIGVHYGSEDKRPQSFY